MSLRQVAVGAFVAGGVHQSDGSVLKGGGAVGVVDVAVDRVDGLILMLAVAHQRHLRGAVHELGQDKLATGAVVGHGPAEQDGAVLPRLAAVAGQDVGAGDGLGGGLACLVGHLNALAVAGGEVRGRAHHDGHHVAGEIHRRDAFAAARGDRRVKDALGIEVEGNIVIVIVNRHEAVGLAIIFNPVKLSAFPNRDLLQRQRL